MRANSILGTWLLVFAAVSGIPLINQAARERSPLGQRFGFLEDLSGPGRYQVTMRPLT
jgi:hypothetical protein